MSMATPDEQREYQRDWIKARRQKWMAENGPCQLCGSSDQLEADHIDPADKLIPPRGLWGMSDSNPRKIAELAKLQVLCQACHKAKSYADRLAKVNTDHGASWSYKNNRCRCQLCKDWNASYRRALRARRGSNPQPSA